MPRRIFDNSSERSGAHNRHSFVPYGNLSGESAVQAYRLGDSRIEVIFQSGDVYLYTVESSGHAAIETMKRLAVKGRGLATFISQEVKSRYARRWNAC